MKATNLQIILKVLLGIYAMTLLPFLLFDKYYVEVLQRQFHRLMKSFTTTNFMNVVNT